MGLSPELLRLIVLDGTCVVCGCSVLLENEIDFRIRLRVPCDDVTAKQTLIHRPVHLFIGVNEDDWTLFAARRWAVLDGLKYDSHILRVLTGRDRPDLGTSSRTSPIRIWL